ncbi:MAG: hypothetical protein QF552_13020 [Litorilituus sp.]|jgi:hypothetical protein|nr:hypothetical protein [Litorilituus sp.]
MKALISITLFIMTLGQVAYAYQHNLSVLEFGAEYGGEEALKRIKNMS